MVRFKIFAIVFGLLASPLVEAQTYDIEVSMGVPMPNTLHWDDVWEVTIENQIISATMPTMVDINVRLEHEGVVYEATTDKFIVSLGSTYLNAAIAKTRNLSILVEDPAHKSFFRQYNEMIDGTYQLCVSLNLYNALGDILYTATNCVLHEVAHPGIIILNTPINGDTVASELLQFSWTHATERVSDLAPYYVLDLVPIRGGQSPNTAITINPKRLSVDQLQNPYWDYPQLERALDTGQAYAWRVIAYTATNSTTRNQAGQDVFNTVGGLVQEIARSEVGYFVCGSGKNQQETKTHAPKTEYYIDLQHSTENQTYCFTSSLPLSLKNPYTKRHLKFQLFDDKHEPIELSNPPIYVEPGLNTLAIDLSSDLVKAEHYYFAELKLSDAEVYLLKLYKEKGD